MHNLNKWSYGITLVLYLTIYFGLLAQIALGAIQVILALILFARFKKIDRKIKPLLLIYAVITSIYLTVFFLFDSMDLGGSDFLHIGFYMVCPMLIATYFVYITYKLKFLENEV